MPCSAPNASSSTGYNFRSSSEASYSSLRTQIAKDECCAFAAEPAALVACLRETLARLLLERPFELEFFLSDAMCFVPVDLSFANRTIRQTDRGVPLHLAPLSLTIQPSESTTISEASTSRDRFDCLDLTDDLKFQRAEITSVRFRQPNGPELTGADPHARNYSACDSASCGFASGAATSYAAPCQRAYTGHILAR